MASMVGVPPSGTSLPFMMPNMDRLQPQPPPAHMGIPPVHIETKAVSISAWMDFDSICKCLSWNFILYHSIITSIPFITASA
ncbi:hypothetical protein QR98_0028850 [Sarcoptes scabiei]|uniref:Uncharacterized protein n=1 Tax=Sarcoptes scabiei TaxID=52283 RepID=A0A131ZZZ7_SARSC|nr:hypothetical protein QR98_0028850 [Sarcoptes scabiei]